MKLRNAIPDIINFYFILHTRSNYKLDEECFSVLDRELKREKTLENDFQRMTKRMTKEPNCYYIHLLLRSKLTCS